MDETVFKKFNDRFEDESPNEDVWFRQRMNIFTMKDVPTFMVMDDHAEAEPAERTSNARENFILICNINSLDGFRFVSIQVN